MSMKGLEKTRAARRRIRRGSFRKSSSLVCMLRSALLTRAARAGVGAHVLRHGRQHLSSFSRLDTPINLVTLLHRAEFV